MGSHCGQERTRKQKVQQYCKETGGAWGDLGNNGKENGSDYSIQGLGSILHRQINKFQARIPKSQC